MTDAADVCVRRSSDSLMTRDLQRYDRIFVPGSGLSQKEPSVLRALFSSVTVCKVSRIKRVLTPKAWLGNLF